MFLRKIYCEELPKYGEQKIDWNKCINKKVKGIYDDLKFEIEIIDYESRYLYIKYLDEELFKINTSSFIKCMLGNLLGKNTNEFKIKIGKIFINDKQNIVITDRKYIKKYKKNGSLTNWKWYKYTCNKCGWTEGWIEESHLLKKVGCSCCKGIIVVEGINDIPTTAPWMIKYFQGGYNEAKLYTKSSGKKIIPKCPECGRIRNKSIPISNIYINKSIGCSCGDGLSYSEKFLFNVLEQLHISFITQASKTTFEWCNKLKYDFYIPNINTIIEIHGEQHYRETYRKGGLNLKEIQQNDETKKQLAKDNGIKNYLIINARHSNLKWIKNNIINSQLNYIYDLTNIDWVKAEEFAVSNFLKTICEFKRDNSDIPTSKISQIFKISQVTVIRYLNKGNKIWDWVKYNPMKEKTKVGIQLGKSSGKAVEIYENNISLGIFKSTMDLERKSEILFNVKLNHGHISNVCNGKINNYKGYTFKYK